MLPEVRTALTAERSRELRLAGCRERLARAAAEGAHHGDTARRRLGRRLISIGVKLAGDTSPHEALEI